MLFRLRSNLIPPEPVGPEHVLRRFSPDLDVPIASQSSIRSESTGVTEIDGGWRIVAKGGQSGRLCLASDLALEGCLVICRAELRSRDLRKSAYLEVRFRASDDAIYSSKGFHTAVKGNNSWTSSETQFQVEADHTVNDVGLRLTTDGFGIVEVRSLPIAKE